MILESERSDLNADRAGTPAKGEGDTAPAVAGIGDIVVGADHGAGPGHQGDAGRIVIERADIRCNGSERGTQRRASGSGSEEQELGCGRTVACIVRVDLVIGLRSRHGGDSA